MKIAFTMLSSVMLAMCLGAAPQIPDANKDPFAPKPIEPELHVIEEIRRQPRELDVVFQRAGDQMKMAMQQRMGFGREQHYGLTLYFSIDLPEGMVPILYEEPKALEAIDAGGTDLTQIDPDRQNSITFINKNMRNLFQETSKFFTLSLGSPSRDIATFDVSTTIPLRVSTKQETHRVRVRRKSWVRIPIDDKKMRGASIMIGQAMENRVNLKVQPAEAANYIKSIVLVSGDLRVFSQGGGSGQNERNYSFSASIGGDEVLVEFELLNGVATVPIEIRLDDEPLP